MAGFCWIHPEFRELAAQHQLGDLNALLARDDGTPVSPHHRRRDIVRLELPDRSGRLTTLYLKRDWDVRWRYLARQLRYRQSLWTPARTELETLLHLAAAGVAVPRPVACVQRLGWRGQGCLILEAVPSAVTLNHYLATTLRDAGPRQREQLFAQLGRELARLHNSGVHQPRLFSTKIYLADAAADENDTPVIGFWGFRQAIRCQPLPFSYRVAGLAALLATLPGRLASVREREILFDAYLAVADLDHRGMALPQAVGRQVERLLTNRHIWEIRESDTEEHRSVRPLESVEKGQMWIDPEYRATLEHCGLASFDRMMNTVDGKLLRRLADRENWRLDLRLPEGGTRGAYLKKHHIRTPRTRVRALAHAGGGMTAGRMEAQNIARLARSGIAAMKLIAYGEKLHADGLLESFVLTEELQGYTQLDHFLERRFPPLRGDRATPRDPHLMTLIAEVASVAAKFHRLGYNHRDLYCCHFFIKETEPGEFKVNLIDLQRVEYRRHFRSRWLVKDLGQLAYSAQTDRITRTHKMAFIKRYLGVQRLRPCDKRFIRKILAKQRWIEAQVRKRKKARAIPAPHTAKAAATKHCHARLGDRS